VKGGCCAARCTVFVDAARIEVAGSTYTVYGAVPLPQLMVVSSHALIVVDSQKMPGMIPASRFVVRGSGSSLQTSLDNNEVNGR
jgi:hypothetical protein